MKPNFLVVGAGLSGAVLARELAETLPCHVLVVDERGHIAGNCHTERDPSTNIMLHVHGPHIFNTDDEVVWRYVCRFARFRPFVNRVKAITRHGVFSLPINLHTINQFFGKCLNPEQAKEFLNELGDRTIDEPCNFEEQALRFIGRELYEAFFYGYTKKQWGCEPRELPASVLKRLPIRFNYDDSYYNKKYQAIPEEGYTAMTERILDHPSIDVHLQTKWKRGVQIQKFQHTFYTGPLDAFFDHALGYLGYRTVTFERIDATGDYQGNPVINYPDPEIPWTRIHEHKHFTPWEKFEKTVAFKEYSKKTEKNDIPYYPMRLAEDKILLKQYLELAKGENNVSFLGRLATYRYMDMEAVIRESLSFSKEWIPAYRTGMTLPKFAGGEGGTK